MTDPKLEWQRIFDDNVTTIDAANCLGGAVVAIRLEEPMVTISTQYLPGYRVKEQQGDMDRAALVRR